MGQRVFVTGATGVLGRRVVPRLVEAGHTVTAVVRSEAKAEGVRAAGATPVLVDLFDRAALRAAIAGHDGIAQLATNVPSGPSAGNAEAWRTHDRLRSVAAPLIADAAAEAGVARLIQEPPPLGDKLREQGRLHFALGTYQNEHVVSLASGLKHASDGLK